MESEGIRAYFVMQFGCKCVLAKVRHRIVANFLTILRMVRRLSSKGCFFLTFLSARRVERMTKGKLHAPGHSGY